MTISTFQHRLFESFQRSGSRIAVEYGEKAVSYSQLEKRFSRVADLITAKGIKKGEFIGIYIEDRIDFIAVLIGILKAGCVFVPLDAGLPIKRVEKILQLTEVRILFSDTLHYEQLLENTTVIEKKIEIIPLAFPLDIGRNKQSKNRDISEYDREDKIYVYCTSGSSGEPKAILGKNKSLLHFINWEIQTFNIGSGTRVTQLTTPAFDAFLRDVFVPLFTGGTVCVPENREITVNGGELSRWIETSRVELMHSVPSLFRILSRQRLKESDFCRLKYVLLSGEKINTHDLENWYNTFGERIQLVNLYGPTETTMIKTFYFIKKEDIEKGTIPIGKPMKGAQVILFDKNMKICSRGTVGEIYIRTPYRTFGYYNNGRLNRRRFIPNPATGNTDDLLYKTGDLGRELEDGNIEFIGRIDRQIKINGVRIEPGEIEHVIQTYPGVTDAVVISVESRRGENLLGAFFASEKKIDQTRVREYLFSLLPDYMVPPYILQMAEIPLLPNGKIDRNELKAVSRKLQLENEYKPPQNPVEQKLVEIWQDILEVEKPGVTDDFFELGGRSLGIVKLASEIKNAFNLEITPDQLYNRSNIKEIAGYIALRESGTILDKHRDEPLVIFNKTSSRKVFFFPPQMGYGIAYKEFSYFLPDYALYSFNFLENENRIKQYVNHILEIQENGPYRLFGYSAGGNLAFEAAKELEKRGKNVTDIIMMDSFSRQVTFKLGTPEQSNIFYSNLGKYMERMGIGFLKEKVIKKSKKYTHYHENSITRGKINANIHLITSTDRKQRETQLKITEPGKENTVLSTGWEQYTTRDYFIYPGIGEHEQMLNPVILEKNAEIIKEILDKAW